jgi:hypothetical protein
LASVLYSFPNSKSSTHYLYNTNRFKEQRPFIWNWDLTGVKGTYCLFYIFRNAIPPVEKECD